MNVVASRSELLFASYSNSHCMCVLTVQNHLKSSTFAQIESQYNDYLLVIHCNLSFISPLSRYGVEKSTTTTPSLSDLPPIKRIPFEFSGQTYRAKHQTFGYFLRKPPDPSYSCFVTIYLLTNDRRADTNL